MNKRMAVAVGLALVSLGFATWALADPVDPASLAGFSFGAGAHGITGEALMAGQEMLKQALGCAGATDPNDMLVFESVLEPGATLLWWIALDEVVVTDVFAEFQVVQTVDSQEDEVALLMVEVGLERGENWTSAYLMVLRDDTEQVGAALPITPECWDGFLTPGLAMPVLRSATCAEQAVDWCNDWYPPSSGPGSGLGGIIGCAEAAAARNANCHNLACITNANDCCERGHGRRYCWWEQWLSGGHNLEHVTRDTVYTLELAACIPVGLIKDLFF